MLCSSLRITFNSHIHFLQYSSFSLTLSASVAQALAGEVVQLEEQRLHARSAELRAGKQGEEMALEARRAKQQQAATAAECSHLQTVVQGLQVSMHAYKSSSCESRRASCCSVSSQIESGVSVQQAAQLADANGSHFIF